MRHCSWWFPNRDSHFQSYLPGHKDFSGLYQSTLFDLAIDMVGNVKGEKFRGAIDIGAHVGLWTKRLARIFDTVYAFEPIKENFDCLKRNCERSKNTVLHELAIHKDEEYIDFELPTQTNSGAWEVARRPTKVGCYSKPLDMIAFRGPIDFIKIDVQGMEYDVIAGATWTLKRHRPVICVEGPNTDAQAALKALKYVSSHQVNEDVVYIPKESVDTRKDK